MTDRSIPFYNIILRCDVFHPVPVELQEGYSIVPYQEGFEKAWAELETAEGDFSSLKEAEDYFVSTYLGNQKLRDRLLFLLSPGQEVVGSCIAWKDLRGSGEVSSLHWLVVDKAHRGRGLGKALFLSAMTLFAGEGSFPVYIHTQPWSTDALLLYTSFGFRIQKTDTFSTYRNEYREAMNTLQQVLPQPLFSRLLDRSE